MINPRNLIHRGAANLPYRFGNAVHAMDIGFPQLSAVGVHRQFAAAGNVPVLDEILGLAAITKTEGFQLRQYPG